MFVKFISLLMLLGNFPVAFKTAQIFKKTGQLVQNSMSKASKRHNSTGIQVTKSVKITVQLEMHQQSRNNQKYTLTLSESYNVNHVVDSWGLYHDGHKP